MVPPRVAVWTISQIIEVHQTDSSKRTYSSRNFGIQGPSQDPREKQLAETIKRPK